MSDQQLIIGMGTGRCGTTSLTSFLNDQPDTRVIHEGGLGGKNYLIHWYEDSRAVVRWLETLGQRAGTNRFGDVAYYFLPHADAILERWPNAKFVVLQRERAATVESFLRKTRWRNHWMDHEGSEWEPDPVYDPTFPTLEVSSKEEALMKYWDLYYKRTDALMATHPDSFTLHSMNNLNNAEGRRAILSFLGYQSDEMVLTGSYRENTELHNAIPTLWHRFRRVMRRAIPGCPPHSRDSV